MMNQNSVNSECPGEDHCDFLIPPELIALFKGCVTSPKIIGWTFQTNKLGVYYAKNSNDSDYVTIDRAKAQVYSNEDIMRVSRNDWNWGRKTQGKWRAVYAQ